MGKTTSDIILESLQKASRERHSPLNKPQCDQTKENVAKIIAQLEPPKPPKKKKPRGRPRKIKKTPEVIKVGNTSIRVITPESLKKHKKSKPEPVKKEVNWEQLKKFLKHGPTNHI